MTCSLALASCDPGVHFGYEKDFDGPLDYDCIEKALRTVAPDVTRTTWSDTRDNVGFPAGTVVTQFNYSDPALHQAYMLNVARVSKQKTHYEHVWSKLGTEVPPEERRQVLPLLKRANEAIAQQCRLSFGGLHPTEGPG